MVWGRGGWEVGINEAIIILMNIKLIVIQEPIFCSHPGNHPHLGIIIPPGLLLSALHPQKAPYKCKAVEGKLATHFVIKIPPLCAGELWCIPVPTL